MRANLFIKSPVSSDLPLKNSAWEMVAPNTEISFFTVFENHRKSLIQHCERSELCLHFEWTKVQEKRQNGQFW